MRTSRFSGDLVEAPDCCTEVVQPVAHAGYLPLLDGVRGLAILLVLIHHFVYYDGEGVIAVMIKKFQDAGWMGVDLFFVLSGFLITGILWDTKGKKAYFRNFYARRALRIFPLYYAYLFCFILLLLVALKLYGDKVQLYRALTDSKWALVYMLNFRIVQENHFVNQGINHFWTLAIEEQFYLLWPCIIYFLTHSRMVRLCIGLVIAAALLRWALPLLHVSKYANHVLMPCRVDCLAFGALIALVKRSPRGLAPLVIWSRWIFPAGLLMLCGCYGRNATFSQFGNLLYSLSAVTFAALLVLVINAQPGSGYSLAFGNRVIRNMGKYAYGIYVFNQLIAFPPGIDTAALHARLVAVLHFPFAATLVHALLGIGISFAVAWVSWHVLEKPFLKLKIKFT